MTLVEKERLCQRELDELRRFIDLDLSAYPADIKAALRFLHVHLFEESLNASRVQRQEGLRSHNLPARFKRHLGLGLRDYIEDRRIMAAMRLLWHQEVEIYLVAAAVGYAHHETFTRAFKRRVGCPPSQFRAHFTSAPVANAPPEPPPASLPASQSDEVLMFITDVVGIRTAEETHDLRVSGTATGVAEVYVNATAGGAARTQVAEVGPNGQWVALFGSDDEEFACGRPLRVEAGSEGRTQVHWEGPLDCAEVAPRRSRAQPEAVAEGAESGDRASARPHGGGNYAGDAAMTVTVATGRGSAPPPLTDSDEGDDEEAPYYERARSKPAAEQSQNAPDDTRDLRADVAALRSQMDTLVRTLDSRSSQPAEDEPHDETPAASEPSASLGEQDGASPSEASAEASDDLREEIAALREELHERSASEEERPSSEEDEGDAAGGGDAADPAWRREMRELRAQVASLREETGEQREPEEDEQWSSPESEDGEESEEGDEPEWQRAIAGLQDQIEALRASDSPRPARQETADPEPDDPEPDDTEPDDTSAPDGGDVEEHDDAVSPQENRADLYEAISALRERIAQLERSDDADDAADRDDADDAADRSEHDAEARRPRPVRREVRRNAPREDPPDDRGPGVLARQRVEERDIRPGQSSERERDVPPARRDASSSTQGLRREDAPIIKFEPIELGDWTGEGQRNARVRARITHPSRQPVAAELTDDHDDRVLAEGRSERGTLTLDEWVALEPGTATFTITVTEPSPARLSMAWNLDAPETRDEAEARDEEETPVEADEADDDETGWVSRAIGAAWGVTVALFLISLAAGVHGFLRGAVTAGFLGFFGSYLALTVPRRWGVWTAAGIGLFALSLVTLLPFTPIIQMDSYLLVAGLATLGLAAAAIVALFVSSD